VWPSATGEASGPAVTPLVPNAVELVQRAPRVADLLAVVDALRVGRARERAAAVDALTEQLLSGNAA
jgi:hypothetical protein